MTLGYVLALQVCNAEQSLPYYVLALAKEGYLDGARGMLERMKKVGFIFSQLVHGGLG